MKMRKTTLHIRISCPVLDVQYHWFIPRNNPLIEQEPISFYTSTTSGSLHLEGSTSRLFIACKGCSGVLKFYTRAFGSIIISLTIHSRELYPNSTEIHDDTTLDAN